MAPHESELQQILKGYPIGDLLLAFPGSPDPGGRDRQIILFLLNAWADRVWRDMTQLPPADQEAMHAMRRRMARERDGLLQLHEALMALGVHVPPDGPGVMKQAS